MQSTSSRCFSCCVLLVVSATAAAAEKLNPKPLPVGMHGHRANVVGDRLYVFGGYARESFVLDSKTRRWEKMPSMLVPKAFFASVVVDGKIYAIGGKSSDEFGVIECYDPAKNRWTELLRSEKLPRSHLSAAGVGDKIYIFGGFPAKTKHMYVFDTKTGKLADAPPLPEFRKGDHFLYMATLAGKLHVLGGMRFEGKTAVLDQHWVLDGERWLKRAKLPNPSMAKFGAYGVLNGKLYVFNNSVELHHTYAPKTDRWSDKPSPLAEELAMPAVVSHGDRLHVLGGIPTKSGRAAATVYTYDAAKNKWTATGQSPCNQLSCGFLKRDSP